MEKNVKVLHAKDLHATRGEFEDWKVITKQYFVWRICSALTPYVPLGVSMSALKETYGEHAVERKPKRTVSAYTFCFNTILDWLLRDIRTGKEANTDGLAFILECGNEHNGEAEQCFYNVMKEHDLGGVLRSISFVPKEKCRAIQMADLLAYYSRRIGAPQEDPSIKLDDVSPTIMNIINGSVPIRAFVATKFGPNSGSRFAAGDLE